MTATIFVMTDVVGSTLLWDTHGDAMAEALATHDDVVHGAMVAAGGRVFKHTGDGMIAAFTDADAATTAALGAVERLAAIPWGATGPLRIRTAIHAGVATARDGDFFGPPVNRVARIAGVAQPGQVLASDGARALLRTPLGRDLGVHQLRDLSEPILLWQLDDGDHPPLATLQTSLHNLPRQASEFIGREHDIREVVALIRDHRLVTITGMGGCGKTRLALEASATLPAEFSGGVWFVDLTAVGDDAGVALRTVEAIGLSLAGSGGAASITAEVALSDYLGRRPSLVVLDNCEHVIDASAELADLILATTGATRILTTSREPLSIDGERVWRVPSLIADAPALFIERARGVDASFAPSPADMVVIGEICGRLDGIPLAIELAAARTTALSLTELRDRLDDRFALLSGGRKVRRQRQQTLQAMMDWSWELLDPDQQRMLAELAVFPATVGIDGVEAVCSRPDAGTALDRLTELVERSLVVAERGEQTRYRLLVTVKLYAADRLAGSGTAAETRDRLVEWVWSFASVAAADIPRRGEVYQRWWELREREADNIIAALDWLTDQGSTARQIDIIAANLQLWLERDDTVGVIDRLRQILDPTPIEGLSDTARLVASATLAFFAGAQFETALAATAAQHGRHLIAAGISPTPGSDAAFASMNVYLPAVSIAVRSGDFDTARSLTAEAEQYAGDDEIRQVLVCGNQVFMASAVGDFEAANAAAERHAQLSDKLGFHHSHAKWGSRMFAGGVLVNLGRYTEAADRYQSALTEGDAISRQARLAYAARATLVIALALDGNLNDALHELHVHEDKLVAAQHDDERTARLMGLATVNHMLGRAERARELLAAIDPPRFFGALGIVYLLTQIIGPGTPPEAVIDRQALIDTELAELDTLDL